MVYILFCNIMLLTNVKYKKRLIEFYYGTDTSSAVDIHWLLETRSEIRCLKESVFTGCLSKPTKNVHDTANVIWK